MSAYTKVAWRGKRFNSRTVAMIKEVEQELGYVLTIFQGSYNAGGVAQSAGTHDGGGAVDLYGRHEDRDKIVQIMREVGFAAWVRNPNQGDWGWHIHAIALGDTERSDGAVKQCLAYRSGKNGLANGGPDYHPRPDPIPVFAYYTVNLRNVRRQWKSSVPRRLPGVKRIQRALNARGANLAVDGVLGPQTHKEFLKWSGGVAPNLRNLARLGRGNWRPKN